jgi:riboflavin kinase / FMN adenylyltransferase
VLRSTVSQLGNPLSRLECHCYKGFNGGRQTLDTFYEIKPGLLKHASLALGFFDGVHPGHEVVIRQAVEEAQRLGVEPAVVTFKEHPRSLTQGKAPQLLTLIDQRLELFEQLGIKAALVLSFTEELCRLAPADYVQSVLVECMGAKALSVGFNHRFGRNRIGDAELLRELGKKFGYTVHVAGEVIIEGGPVSSSRIRQAITHGYVDAAQRLLGRPFAIGGAVAHGEGRGHTIGFPTANITIPEEQVEPAIGVYVVVVRLPDGQRLRAVVNIGRRPTFGNAGQITTEVHVLDYDGDLYGKTLQLEFLKHLRPEQKFDGIDQLKAQITRDVEETRAYFKTHPERLTVREKLVAEQH